MFCQQQIGGSRKQQEDRITSREMKVLLLVAIVTSAQFFGISNGHKHHNHKPSKSQLNSKQEVRGGRVSKPFRKAFGELFDSYKSSNKEDKTKRTKGKRRRQKVSEGKRKEELGSEPNTKGGKLSRPSHNEKYHYVIEVGHGQHAKDESRKKAVLKNLSIANINRFQNSRWLNKQVSRNEGERKQLDIPGCGGSVKI